MKILIITIHRPANCGSALQAFALNYYLNSQNFDAALIDYVPEYLETEGNKLRNFLRKTLFYIPYHQRKRNFKEFIETNCKLTQISYKSYKELEENPPKADVYITGSDQLWNPCFNCGRDDAYYLSFVKSGNKMSYATSLGNSRMSDQELGFVASRLHEYTDISVREECSVGQLKEHGIEGVQWVCDPTLLLGRAVYDSLAKSYTHLGKYTAVYLVEHSQLLNQLLEYLHAEKGLQTVGVGGYLRKYKCDVRLSDAGPREFLGLIRDAEFVLATSFHATVFSLIFHKNFAIIPPKINAARIEQLLGYLGLEQHIITDISQLSKAVEPIDYEEVDKKLNSFCENSKTWLLKTLEKMENEAKGND